MAGRRLAGRVVVLAEQIDIAAPALELAEDRAGVPPLRGDGRGRGIADDPAVEIGRKKAAHLLDEVLDLRRLERGQRVRDGIGGEHLVAAGELDELRSGAKRATRQAFGVEDDLAGARVVGGRERAHGGVARAEAVEPARARADRHQLELAAGDPDAHREVALEHRGYPLHLALHLHRGGATPGGMPFAGVEREQGVPGELHEVAVVREDGLLEEGREDAVEDLGQLVDAVAPSSGEGLGERSESGQVGDDDRPLEALLARTQARAADRLGDRMKGHVGGQALKEGFAFIGSASHPVRPRRKGAPA